MAHTTSSSTTTTESSIGGGSHRPWSNLPCELVEQISNRLAILELISFRSTCRQWRRFASHSTSTSSTIISQEKPWFLHYSKDEYLNCNLYDPCSNKIYTKINIPEFGEGVECIASKGGWLLLYGKCDGSFFFFCPFSRARIDLPKPPEFHRVIIPDSKVLLDESLVFHRIATFSSPPTSPDCIVCVCTQTMFPPTTSDGYRTYTIFAVDVLRRGANQWSFCHMSRCRPCDYEGFFEDFCTDKVRSAILWKESIYFLYFSMKGTSFALGSLLERTSFSFETWEDNSPDNAIELDCGFRVTPVRAYFSEGLDKGKLGLKVNDSLSICGTELQGDDPPSSCGNIKCIFYEEIKVVDDDGEEEAKEHKGVWIQPRFFQLPSNYKW